MSEPKKYRKKPVAIEAIQITADNIHDVAKWCGGTPGRTFGDDPNTYAGMDIPTLEGVMAARLGDWVIKGVVGEFYPCRPDVFDATYKDASDALAADILEYRIEHQHIDNGMWHPLTQWSPEWPLNDGYSVAPDERIICRRVARPREVTDD